MPYAFVGDLISKAKIEKCGNNNYPVLSMTMKDGIVFQNDRFKKQIASIDQSTYNVVKRKQLVVSFPIDEGVLAVQDITDIGIVSPAYKIWNIDENKVIPKYLELFLRSPHSIQYYKSKLRGSTARRRSITDSDLLGMEIPLKTIEEQQRIICSLNKARAIITHHQTQLTKLDELIKARFVEMFGDPMLNPKGYSTKTYGELFELNAGGTPSKNKPEYWENGTISWIGSNLCQNVILYENDGKYISQEGYEHSSAKMFPVNTVLIALVGATIGKTALLKFETSTNQNVLGVRHIEESGYNPVFVYYYTQFLHQKFIEIGDGGFNMASKGFVSELPIYNVDLLTQNQFSDFATQIDQTKSTIQKSLDKAQLLFDSLMQEYFG